MAGLNNIWHVAEEESKKKCRNMRTIDIGIRHEDDLMITETVNIKLIADTYAETFNERDELSVCKHLIKTSTFGIKHLTTKWEDSLNLRIAAFLSRTSSGVTLYDEEFAIFSITRGTIGEFTWEIKTFESTFSDYVIASGTSSLASASSKGSLTDDFLSDSWIFLEVVTEVLDRKSVV